MNWKYLGGPSLVVDELGRILAYVITASDAEIHHHGELMARAPKLRAALEQIATIKKQIPFDAADAATECIRIAKEALK